MASCSNDPCLKTVVTSPSSSKRKFENILAQDGKFKYSDSGRLQPTVHMKGLSVAYQEEMIPG
ncbi:hypothetical protein DERF_002693 [Dermatophagoides farinae]|uniref:Uncharacterized protein n=1 Tax=Dermatophagoides farinae TaxID=6954 RepID=A0A922IG19_DERFA|nr:hypothetical protein DERF_002693 [Dermatophagoides farinae]